MLVLRANWDVALARAEWRSFSFAVPADGRGHVSIRTTERYLGWYWE